MLYVDNPGHRQWASLNDLPGKSEVPPNLGSDNNLGLLLIWFNRYEGGYFLTWANINKPNTDNCEIECFLEQLREKIGKYSINNACYELLVTDLNSSK